MCDELQYEGYITGAIIIALGDSTENQPIRAHHTGESKVSEFLPIIESCALALGKPRFQTIIGTH